MKIQLLYILDCPWCVKTKELIRKSLKELNVKADIKELLIDSEEKSRKYGFTGSPTIRIDGKDIQEKVIKGRCLPCEEIVKENMVEFVKKECSCGCRIYFYKGENYPYPPKEMIKDAIIKLSKKQTKNINTPSH